MTDFLMSIIAAMLFVALVFILGAYVHVLYEAWKFGWNLGLSVR